MELNIKNETSTLQTVVIGVGESLGKKPLLEETYDANSYFNILNNTYPQEKDIKNELNILEGVLKKYNVQVLKPRIIKGVNQIFARDVFFVIDDKLIISNMIAERKREQDAYQDIIKLISSDKIIQLPSAACIEGGDVILYNDLLFIGVYKGKDFESHKTARTNPYAVQLIKELFPHKTVIEIELYKNDKNPYCGVLHLDCTFMPIGKDKALIYKEGFKNQKDIDKIEEIFTKNNIVEVSREEAYHMNTNLFSINPTIIISDKSFTRINNILEKEWNFVIEKIPFQEVAKMGGLLRCSTFPLIRKNN